MKILQIIDGMAVGGAEKLMVTFTQESFHRGLPVTILSLRQDVSPHFEQQIKTAGGELAAFPKKRLLNLGRIQKVARFIKKGEYDIVQTHLTYANIVGTIASRLAGTPAIGTLHLASLDTGLRSRARQMIETLALRRAAASVVAVGQNVADVHQPRLRGQTIDVVPNGVALPQTVTPEDRQTIREELVSDASRPLVISAGRLAPQKAYHDLIAAFALVHRQFPEAALVIAGEGDLRPQLEAQIKALDLGNTVFLAGILGNIPQLFASADIFALSSHWEGLPLVVLEAMMAGLAPVLTRVGDIPTAVIPGTGLLTPPKQPAEMAAALIDLLDNPHKRQEIGLAAQQHALGNYSQSVWCERLVRIYGRTCQQDVSIYL